MLEVVEVVVGRAVVQQQNTIKQIQIKTLQHDTHPGHVNLIAGEQGLKLLQQHLGHPLVANAQ